MSGTLYLRRVTVHVGPVVVKYDSDNSLRVRFRVQKNPYATEPNRATVEIYNLADSRRELLDTLVSKRAPIPVSIEAGYADAVGVGVPGVLFKGRLQSVAHTRDKGDWGTKVIAASTSSRDVPVTETYEAPNLNVGAVAADILRKIAKGAAGLDVSSAVARALKGDLAGVEQQFSKAFAVNGIALGVIEKIVGPHGFRVSEQDGVVVLLKEDEARGRAIALDSDSGLVGAIEPLTDARRPGAVLLRARSLLRHDIAIGSAIQLRSVVQRGLYVVEQVDHHGDTHGYADSFITVFQGRGIRGGGSNPAPLTSSTTRAPPA